MILVGRLASGGQRAACFDGQILSDAHAVHLAAGVQRCAALDGGVPVDGHGIGSGLDGQRTGAGKGDGAAVFRPDTDADGIFAGISNGYVAGVGVDELIFADQLHLQIRYAGLEEDGACGAAEIGSARRKIFPISGILEVVQREGMGIAVVGIGPGAVCDHGIGRYGLAEGPQRESSAAVGGLRPGGQRRGQDKQAQGQDGEERDDPFFHIAPPMRNFAARGRAGGDPGRDRFRGTALLRSPWRLRRLRPPDGPFGR